MSMTISIRSDVHTSQWNERYQGIQKNGVSGGSTDIDPEPEGKQNGTAPLQDAKEK